jgi:hypothetical protein
MPVQAETIIVDAPLTAMAPMQTWQRPGRLTRSEVRLQPRALGGTCLDLVVHSSGPGLLGGPALGEVVHAPRSLSVVDLVVRELGLSSFPGTPSPPVSWR